MLKRGGKSSYNPYSTTQRVKKPEWKDRLDILPNRHSVWLKQVGQKLQMLFSFWETGSFFFARAPKRRRLFGILPGSPHPSGSVAQCHAGSCESLQIDVFFFVVVVVEGKGDACGSVNHLSLFQLSIVQEQPRKDAGDVTLSSSPASSSSSISTPTSAGFIDPSGSSPGTPSMQHGKLGVMQGVGCPSPVATLRRPTSLSRHASAAGQQMPMHRYQLSVSSGSGAFNLR